MTEYKMLQNPVILNTGYIITEPIAESLLSGKPIISALEQEELKEVTPYYLYHIVKLTNDDYLYEKFLALERKKYTIVSLVADFSPLLGDAKGIYEAFSGKDYLTGEPLAWWERALGLVCLSELRTLRRTSNISSVSKQLDKVDEIIEQTDIVKKYSTKGVKVAEKATKGVATNVDELKKISNEIGVKVRKVIESDGVFLKNEIGFTERGVIIEKILLNNLGAKFPIVDRLDVADRVVVSIKSIDTSLNSYVKKSGLKGRIKNCIDDLDNFLKDTDKIDYEGISVYRTDFDVKRLELVIPNVKLNEGQIEAVNEMIEYATNLNIDLHVIVAK